MVPEMSLVRDEEQRKRNFPPRFATNERNGEQVRTKKRVTVRPWLRFSRGKESLTTFITFLRSILRSRANDSRRATSKCVQTTLPGKCRLSHRVCVTTCTHLHGEIFLCQRDALARKHAAVLGSRPARTLVTSRKSGSYVSLLCNFNNHILRPSRKMADDEALEDGERVCRFATRENLLKVSRSPRRDLLKSQQFCATRYVTVRLLAKENRFKLLASSARKISTRVANHGHGDTRSSFRNELVDTPFAFGTDRKLPRPFAPYASS